MQQALQALYLRHFNYGDTSVILKAFTQQYGAQSFIIKGARKKRNIVASLQPFHVFELTTRYRPEKELQTANKLNVIQPLKSIPLDIRKSTVAVFVTEILYELIKQEPENKNLFAFIHSAINWFDEADFSANFHLRFIVEILGYLGIKPSSKNRFDDVFSLEKGVFVHRDSKELMLIDPFNSLLLNEFLESDFNSCNEIKLTPQQRNDFIDFLLIYLKKQLGIKPERINSHIVLKTVFS